MEGNKQTGNDKKRGNHKNKGNHGGLPLRCHYPEFVTSLSQPVGAGPCACPVNGPCACPVNGPCACPVNGWRHKPRATTGGCPYMAKSRTWHYHNIMKNNVDIHHRRSIRLKGYDYSQAGLYFITICTQNRLCLFGKIKNGKMILTDAGTMIQTLWHEIPVYYRGFNIHEFVVMPNHIHGIIQIISHPQPVGAGPCACPINEWQQTTGQPRGVAPTWQYRKTGQPRGVAPTMSLSRTGQYHKSVMSLSDIVHRFKTLTTKRYTDGVKNNGWQPFNKKLWQRNYYEHIIRDEKSYHSIAEYIQTNPLKWEDDKYYA